VTPEQVRLVQSSFAELAPHAADLAARFYDELFERRPALRGMFSTDPAAQEALFAAELGTIVHSISSFDGFAARTRDLGARHVAYGVTYEHYAPTGEALLAALGGTLGPLFAGDLREAWRLAFDLVAETMMQGAAEVYPRGET
jgi:hemoglobin-like flavoprotein